jgi:hypothetical protein
MSRSATRRHRKTFAVDAVRMTLGPKSMSALDGSPISATFGTGPNRAWLPFAIGDLAPCLS